MEEREQISIKPLVAFALVGMLGYQVATFTATTPNDLHVLAAIVLGAACGLAAYATILEGLGWVARRLHVPARGATRGDTRTVGRAGTDRSPRYGPRWNTRPMIALHAGMSAGMIAGVLQIGSSLVIFAAVSAAVAVSIDRLLAAFGVPKVL